MNIYTNKRANVKAGQLAKFPYVPNQLVYIKSIGTKEIEFYGFFKDAGEAEISPKKHTINRKLIKDFQVLPEGYKPVEQVSKWVKELDYIYN